MAPKYKIVSAKHIQRFMELYINLVLQIYIVNCSESFNRHIIYFAILDRCTKFRQLPLLCE